MKQFLPIILALILVVPVVNAQTLTVKGRVTGVSDADPLPGVSVVIKGTQRGTTTNAEGGFQIDVPDQATVLVFSFVGYKSIEETLVQELIWQYGLLLKTSHWKKWSW
jgi:hypothetical protein